jgi:hypothetical protein
MRDMVLGRYCAIMLLAAAIATHLPAAPGSAGDGLAPRNAPRTWYVAADAGEAGAGTLQSPFRTIQPAINAAWDGDLVVVLEGRYAGAGNVELDFQGKAITVQSRAPHDDACRHATILDGHGQGLIARFVHDEGPQTVLRGFTVLAGDCSVPVRGLPGFFEFSPRARPTTGELSAGDHAPYADEPELPPPSGPSAGSRVWEGSSPFYQPANTTEYYGSGDVDADGSISAADIVQAQAILSGTVAANLRADVDGSGAVDGADVAMIAAAVNSGAMLPAWWNRLTSRDARIAWVQRFVALDRTDEHPYRLGFQCSTFAQQLALHANQYRGDLYATNYTGGQRGFDLPMYKASVSMPEIAHGIDAILVGDNPLNMDDWLFVEPQTDLAVTPGAWNMMYDSTVSIETTDWVGGNAETGRGLVSFYVAPTGWDVTYFSPELVLTRPDPPASSPDNRLDSWRPRVLPAQRMILFEQNRDDLPHPTDIYLGQLPFTSQPTGTPLLLAEGGYARILDACPGAAGTVHLLYTAQPAYEAGVFYAQVDLHTQAVVARALLTLGRRNPLMGRILVTPQGQVHAFWFDAEHVLDRTFDSGVYWTTGAGSTWQDAQNITPNIQGDVLRLAHGVSVHDAITYLFDTAMTSSGEIVVAYGTYLNGSIGNQEPAYIVRYDGQWGAPQVVGDPPITAYGLDLSVGSGDVLHLLYWLGELSWDTRGVRGNLYHMLLRDGSWSAPTTIDSSGLAGYPRSAMDALGRLGVMWERMTADSVVPMWATYSDGMWGEAEELPVRPGAEAWYPDVNILPGGQALLYWSSQSADDVTIETTSRWLSPPAGQAFLPLLGR